MLAFERLVESLGRAGVRFVVIGLAGANYYARSGGGLFATQDRDLFLPLDPQNALAAWQACEALGLALFCGAEPLDRPHDRMLAERVVANRALVRATDGGGLEVDFTLVMTGVAIPVARLGHIVESKRRAGRDKDRLFLATHAETIRDLIESEHPRESAGPPGAHRRGGRRPSAAKKPRR